MPSKAYIAAIKLLSRREHSTAELTRKLIQKGYSADDIEEALAECQRLNLQSDSRFCEAICRWRITQGYGPLRIRQELEENKIPVEQIDTVLSAEKENWYTHALDVKKKKYKDKEGLDFITVQKQKQFLYYRGFPVEIINQVFKYRESGDF